MILFLPLFQTAVAAQNKKTSQNICIANTYAVSATLLVLRRTAIGSKTIYRNGRKTDRFFIGSGKNQSGTSAPENRFSRTLLILFRKKEFRNHITLEPNRKLYRKLIKVPMITESTYSTRFTGLISAWNPKNSIAASTDGMIPYKVRKIFFVTE